MDGQFENSIHADQARHFVRPDLGPRPFAKVISRQQKLPLKAGKELRRDTYMPKKQTLCWNNVAFEKYETYLLFKVPGYLLNFNLFTLVLLNKLRCHAHFQFSANQIT